MADKRKLQTEIDRCLKTVVERLEIFQETWDKVESASNGNQKEKYETDLKKEIKKLQRLRDQIKTWLAGNEAKTQKTILMEHRRLIEVEMERFKVMERQAKTKAFSKEGLAAASQISPREKERMRIRVWLNDSVNTLNMQIEGYEAEIELASSGKKGKKGKSSISEKETRLLEVIERHRFHIGKLEMLMRMIDKGSETDPDLDMRIEEALTEDLRYYLEEHMDDDFCENEFMYDDFEELLDTEDLVDATKARQEAEAEREAKEAKEAKEQEQKEREEAKRAAEKHKREAEEARQEKAEQERQRKEAEKKAAASKKKAAAAATSNTATIPTPEALSPKPSPSKVNFAAAAAAAAASPNVTKSPPNDPAGRAGWAETAGASAATTVSPGSRSHQPGTMPQVSPQPGADGRQAGSNASASAPKNDAHASQQVGQGGATPPTIQAASPQRQQRVGVPQNAALEQNLRLLMASSMQKPEQPEQSRGIATPNPHSVPPSYPDMAPAHFSRPEFFSSLEPDTLFFIFYHLQGTYQQYLAARELKNQAWRFHKKYLTWFQRFEEPKIITDEYEQGTYIYFDFEAGWCQRKKTDFTFEYCFLEDQDLSVP